MQKANMQKAKAKKQTPAKHKSGRKAHSEKQPAMLLRGEVAKGGSSSSKKIKIT